jgi:hypothetical protein
VKKPQIQDVVQEESSSIADDLVQSEVVNQPPAQEIQVPVEEKIILNEKDAMEEIEKIKVQIEELTMSQVD